MILPLLLLIAAPAQAAEISFCPGSLELARRNGSPRCWVSFPIELHKRVCIPKETWVKWLNEDNPSSLCGTWRGQWKTGAPFWNESAQDAKPLLRRLVATEIPRDSGGPVVRVRRWIERQRERANDLLDSTDRLGIARRLVVNQRGSSDRSGAFQLLGFVHLVTATGIHLFVLAVLWDRAFRAIFSMAGLSPGLGFGLSRAGATLIWLSAWLLTGARPGMLRPWLVICVRRLGQLAGVRWRRAAPLGIALSIDLMVAVFLAMSGHPEPWAPGRVVYALAVGGGMLAMQSGHLALSVASWIFAGLFEAWMEGHAAPGTPILNLLSLPLFCWVLYPLCLLSVTLDSPLLSDLAGWIATRSASALAQGVMSFSLFWTCPRWAVLAGAFAAAAMLALRARALHVALGLLLCRAMLEIWPARAVTQIEQVDVGQGDSALVLDSNGAGLIDTGSERALSAQNWLGYLSSRGLTSLDWIALTHLDEDHAGGLIQLARVVRIGCVASSSEELQTERGRAFQAKLQFYGTRVSSWEEGCFPHSVYTVPSQAGKRNGNMSLMVIRWNGGFYLNAGDADEADERRSVPWIRSLDLGGERRILKLSHHGSRFSTDREFLKAVLPTEAWVSSGAGNQHGHPSVIALERLGAVPLRRTDREGAIRFSEK